MPTIAQTTPAEIQLNRELEGRRVGLVLDLSGDYGDFVFGRQYVTYPTQSAELVREWMQLPGNEWIPDVLFKEVYQNATEKRRKHVTTGLDLVERALRSAQVVERIWQIQADYGKDLLRTLIYGRYGFMITTDPATRLPWPQPKLLEYEAMLEKIQPILARFDAEEQRNRRGPAAPAKRGKSANKAARAAENRALAKAGGAGSKTQR